MYKKLLSTILFSGFSLLNAQEISNYKYFQIIPNTTDFDGDKYKLENRLKYYLEKKNYVFLDNDNATWPTDLNKDNCAIAKAEVNKLKSFTTNKIEIKFKDCKNQTIQAFEGISKIKEFEKGYPDALLKGLNQIALSNPTITPATTVKSEYKKEINQQIKGESVAVATNKIYTDGTVEATISKLDNGSLLLISEYKIIAQFNPTSREGMYRVSVNKPNGETYISTGFTTENSLHFDIQNEQNEWTEKVFKLK